MQNIAMNITYVLLEDVRISFILTFCATNDFSERLSVYQ